MKILYNIAALSNSRGMERVLANKSNWLTKKGYEVVIVTTDQRGLPPFFPMNDKIKFYDLGVNYCEDAGNPFIKRLLHYITKQIRHRRR